MGVINYKVYFKIWLLETLISFPKSNMMLLGFNMIFFRGSLASTGNDLLDEVLNVYNNRKITDKN